MTVNVIEWLAEFRTAHPEIKIKPPVGASPWEVTEADGTLSIYAAGALMREDLAARYPED
jgi:hypothetical protein